MAVRLSQKLLITSRRLKNTTHPHRIFSRPLNNLAQQVQPITVNDPTDHHLQPRPPLPINQQDHHLQPTIDLKDHRKLFSTIPTSKLFKSVTTLQLAAVDPVVDLGLWITRSKLIHTPITGNLIRSFIKSTFYDQFVAGEDLDETARTIARLSHSGLHTMLAYGAEHAHDEPSCDNNYDQFINSLNFAHSLPPSSVSFVILKISAICPIQLLSRLSDHLRWQKLNSSTTHLPWKRPTLPIFTNSSPLYHTRHQPQPLTPHEEKLLDTAHHRLNTLSQRCSDFNIPLAVDAEDTFVQPAIDYLTYSSALQYNKHNTKPIVYGTVQAYLRDAREKLGMVTEAAEKDARVSMGFKLVRGAYMSSETKTAASLGFESPIHSSIQDTHDCYNHCASYLIDKAAQGSAAVVLATHNVESGQLAAKKAGVLLTGKKKKNTNVAVEFAQLYGMSESLTYGLSNAGFKVSKYLTFGAVQQVMPFLLRRAEENRGMLSSSTLDRKLMWMELRRRLKAGE